MGTTAGHDPTPEELEAEVEALRARTAELEARLSRGDEAPVGGRRRGRGMVAVALVVVGSLLAPIAVVALWTRNLVAETERYVDTVAPLADDPAIQSLVAARITDRLFAEVDVESLVTEALPEDAQFLAGPLTSALRTAVNDVALRLIESDQFRQLWVEANRLAHAQLVAVLTGDGNAALDVQDGTVSVDVTGILGEVNQRLQASGIDLFASVDLPSGALTIPIFQSDDLARLQVAFGAFDRLATILPWLSILALGGGVLLWSDRRRGLLWAGAGVSLGMLSLLLTVTLGRTLYLAAIPASEVPGDAAAAVFDILFRFLRQGARAVLALGLLVLVASLVMGPSDAAGRLRRWVATMLGRVGDETGARVDLGPVGAFVVRNTVALRVAVGVLAVVVLLWWDQPTATVVFGIALAALVGLGAIEVLGHGAAGRAALAGISGTGTASAVAGSGLGGDAPLDDGAAAVAASDGAAPAE